MTHHVFEFSAADLGYSLAYAVSEYEEKFGRSPSKIAMSTPMIARLPLDMVMIARDGSLTYCGIPIIEVNERICSIYLCDEPVLRQTKESSATIKEYCLYQAEKEKELEELNI